MSPLGPKCSTVVQLAVEFVFVEFCAVESCCAIVVSTREESDIARSNILKGIVDMLGRQQDKQHDKQMKIFVRFRRTMQKVGRNSGQEETTYSLHTFHHID